MTWLVKNRLAAFERQHGYDASYMRELLAIDPKAFWAFARATRMSRYRRDVPKEAYYAVGLVGTMAEDCGPCTQLGVGFALEEGLSPALVAAVVAGDEAALPREAVIGMRFARAVLARDPEADVWREEAARRWGPRAVIALAFGVLSTQMYPMIKYALGHGKACTRVVVDGKPVTPYTRPAVAQAVGTA